MSIQEMFAILRLLSAMESAMFTAKVPMPEHLGSRINEAIASLQDGIEAKLKGIV